MHEGSRPEVLFGDLGRKRACTIAVVAGARDWRTHGRASGAIQAGVDAGSGMAGGGHVSDDPIGILAVQLREMQGRL